MGCTQENASGQFFAPLILKDLIPIFGADNFQLSAHNHFKVIHHPRAQPA
jgi:hypothetical protein